MTARLILGLLATSALAQAQTPMDKTLVTVNGQAIDGRTYYKRMEVMPNVGQLVNDKFVPATPGFLVLTKLVNEALMLQLAKDKGVAPTRAEIDAEFARRTKENPELMPGLKRIGFTDEDLKYDISLQIAEFKLTTLGITITDLEVEKFYKDHPADFTKPKRHVLRVIVAQSDEVKAKVDAAFAAGKPFREVARELSEDINRVEDGLMGEVPEANLGEKVREAIIRAGKGRATDWLLSGTTWAMFFVEDTLAAETVPLDAELKALIRRNMALDRGRIRNDIGAMMEETRKKAKIEYGGTAFDDQLKRVFGG
ncbi:MAG: peptidyl-prolyl cis-trans isomerase [Fimbriimonadaceae bacterium]|nr:peptidyl-prolyl cis-trans isomerase [Fimbriimonadaceae bacterium]QYK58906.1 MAG: peptidyl-prolyl cis-trans isomerase [Fimbriimonadaceae bacterium]